MFAAGRERKKKLSTTTDHRTNEKQINPDLTATGAKFWIYLKPLSPDCTSAPVSAPLAALSARVALIYMRVCKEIPLALVGFCERQPPETGRAVAALICGAGRRHGSPRNNTPASS